MHNIPLLPSFAATCESAQSRIIYPPQNIPRHPVIYDSKPEFVKTAQRAREIACTIMQQPLAWTGLDTEYSVDPTTGDARLLTVQFSPARPNGGKILISGGIVFDMRDDSMRGTVSELLRLPVRFVVHHARAEYQSLTGAGLPFPLQIFDTYLGMRLCTLGTPDWQDYLEPDSEFDDDNSFARARQVARQKKEKDLSLLGLCSRFSVQHRFADEKTDIQQRFAAGASIDGPMVAYAAEDAKIASALYPHVVNQLMVQGLLSHFEQIELPALPVFLSLERTGVTVDRSRLESVRSAAQKACDAFSRSLRSRARTLGVNMDNPNSPPQRLALVKALGCEHLFSNGATPDGQKRYSFARDKYLKPHRKVHPAIDDLYRYAKLRRINSDKLFLGGFTAPNGLTRGKISPLGSNTGRPSFSEPNFASVARIFRPIVVCGEDEAIIEIDYKFQEPGIAAAHFGDTALLEAWNAEGDFYLRMGNDLGIDANRFTLKLLVLAALYGQGARSAAANLGVSERRARRLLGAFYGQYSDLHDGMKAVQELAQVCGYAQTRTGLKRYLSNRQSVGQRNRRARNLPVQGGGATILKALLPLAQGDLQQMGGRILVPHFDSLVFQVPRVHADEAIRNVSHHMSSAMQSIYPELRPRLDVNSTRPKCWNKDGHADSIERFSNDPFFDID
jgi:DNA polymerase I-like protein with 3'-5' exonuclease and polymerase domains